MKHLQITVSGRVQGVWFRAKTKEKADELGICGIVKNMANKKVYIEAEGPPEELRQFVSWCKEGPRLAYVDELVQEPGTLKNYTSFSIMR